MSLLEFTLLAFSSLFVIVDPIAVVPAFLAMTLTGFKGIREMGIIAGGGLLVCLIPMMTLLPAMLLSRHEGGCRARPPGKARRRRERIE